MITTRKCGDITLLTLVNARGASVTLSTLGAGIVSIIVPDSHGNLADVVLGYDNPADYMADGPCMGKIPGRYANRIALGRFTLDGIERRLAVNNGPNALHGGPTGFQNRLWTVARTTGNSVTMTYTSADGEEGYPGQLTAEATYTWDDTSTLRLTLSAVTTAPTVVNLTNHTYFNLGGHNSGTALHHTLRLGASRWLPTDATLVPTGELAPVASTPMDFTTAKKVGRDMGADFPALRYGKGYDNCWVIDDADGLTLRVAAELHDPTSGRTVTVATTQPGVQIYTGNWLDGSPRGKDGAVYADYDGIAIECQDFPDAPNRPAFPSTVLRPGDRYERVIEMRFT